MTLKTIYIARHGYRSNWLPEPHPPSPTGIHSDPPLAAHGVEQAKQLAGYLHSLPSLEQPQFLISSPFYRCVETCQPIAQMLSLKVVLERGVGEWYRKKRRVIPTPANYDVLHQFFHEILVEESEWPRDETVGVIPSLDGETPSDIFDRASLFWSKFIPIFESKYPQIDTILIVTHAATKIALGNSLLDLKSVHDSIDEHGTKLRAGACSLDKYIRSNENSWINKMNGNCTFLTKGEEMHWDFSSTVEAGSDEDIRLRKEREELEKKKQQQSQQQRETTPVTDIASGNEGISNEDFEDIYVTVDIPMIGKSSVGYDDSSTSNDLSRHHNKGGNANATSSGSNSSSNSNSNTSTTTSTKVNYIKPSAQFQFTDLNHSNPLIKLSNNAGANGTGGSNDIDGGIDNINVIDGKIYETNWKRLVGTDLIFDDYGELIGKVKEHLTINENVKISAKEIKDSKIKDEDMDDGDELVHDSTFLNRAIKYAKRKSATGTGTST